MDAYQNYWKEAIECSLDGLGIPNALTPEQYEAVAKDLQMASEMQGMAFGHDCIPNPRDAEIEKLESKVKAALRETERATLDFKKNVAIRHGCEVQDVTLEDDGSARVAWSKLA